MAYGNLAVDGLQGSTAGVPPKFYDGDSTEIGTLCRAWVNFNGVTTATIRASFNVSSVTRNGTGDYTVNFTNAMPDANYSATMFSKAVNPYIVTLANGSARVFTNNGSNVATDTDTNCVSIFR